MNLLKQFENYLLSKTKVSKKSLKFYRSDFINFLNWLAVEIQKLGYEVKDYRSALSFLNNQSASYYKTHLVESRAPFKTINRRLATLRHLSAFLQASKLIDFDFMAEVQNQTSKLQIKRKPAAHAYSEEISAFEAHLMSQGHSRNTIKNYLNDIKQYYSWVKNAK